MDVIASHSRWLKSLTTVVLAVLIFALGLEVFMIMRADDFEASLRWSLPFRLPMLFYIASIWAMRQAFAQLERGLFFDRMLPALLARIGFALAAGATTTVFFTPWLWRLLCGPRRGGFAAFDPPAIAVGLVGLLLVILARLLVRAVAMKRDLDGFL